MAKIAAFRGLRYDPSLVDISDVTSPPYDVISPEDNEYFHTKHPNNMVRLILGREMPEDDEQDNRFTRAASFLDDWMAKGIVKQDDKPAIYVYEQHYETSGEAKTVRGFIALVKLQDYSDGVILPHENTLAKPKSHLAPLIRATEANLDSVYALYPDPEHTVDAILDRAAETTPAAEAVDRNGVRHRLWVIDTEDDIALITSTLDDRQIVIADGHHRYETSLAYRGEVRAASGNPESEQPCDYIMMTLINVYAPDVIVLPTHRMVRNLPEDAVEGLDMALSERFVLVESNKNDIVNDLRGFKGRAIGVYKSGVAFVAVPRPGSLEDLPVSLALKMLDVYVLHELILDRVLGIDSEKLRQEANIVYTRDEAQAFASVDSGEYQLAFILNPMKVESILNVARDGERMPQKATYFYPKLLSGLVMRKIAW